MDNMTPGWKTTEFYVTIFASLVTVLVLVFGLPKVEGDNLVKAVTEAIPLVVAVVAQALVVLGYITGRNLQKAFNKPAPTEPAEVENKPATTE